MQHNITIPTTILDNFFDNPDGVRQWAIQQPFYPSPDGRWPGMRTEDISKTNNLFFDLVVRKSLSLFFDLKTDEQISWNAKMMFQIVHENYDSGWTHHDGSFNDLITGIIYLNKNKDLAGGTSLMKLKDNIFVENNEVSQFKSQRFLKKSTIDEVAHHREAHNSQYEETIKVSNIYNRLLMFDSHLLHKAQNFFGKDEDARLTLIFFIQNLRSNGTPISRFHRTL